MRLLFSLLGLVFVVAIIGVNVRNSLRATRLAMPAPGPASGASAPFGGTSSPSVAQFQRELDKTMREVNQRAAHSGDEADSAR
jgi:hypothetical protein